MNRNLVWVLKKPAPGNNSGTYLTETSLCVLRGLLYLFSSLSQFYELLFIPILQKSTLNRRAVIRSPNQGHAASKHGADMWIDAGTFNLYGQIPT